MESSRADPVALTFENLLNFRNIMRENQNHAGVRFVSYCAAHQAHSFSQLFQDLLVVFCLNEKRGGYFVEFGAADGVNLSNTVLLEREFGWRGLLAEPARRWHAALRTNRSSASIDTRCVWSKTGAALDFKETEIAELSTLTELVDRDFNRTGRTKGINYSVETVSLNDLLAAHHSPREIDYMSVDTEGSELAILQELDFSKYDIKVLTVEHNYCEPDRTKIHELLQANGLIRIFEPLSKFDDWYVKRSIVGL